MSSPLDCALVRKKRKQNPGISANPAPVNKKPESIVQSCDMGLSPKIEFRGKKTFNFNHDDEEEDDDDDEE